MKCKHESGWYATTAYKVYVTPEWQTEIGESGAGRRNRVEMTCNEGCGAVRNIYFKTSAVASIGRLRRPK